MKVAFYGNTCNNFYTLAKALRQKLDVDAHLYLHPKADLQNRPESDDPELKNNYPDWIHMSPRWDPLQFMLKGDKAFIRELNKYEVVFFSHLGVSLAPYIKAKTIFYVTGGDLTQIPFARKYAFLYKNILHKIAWRYVGYWQRKGIQKVDKILSQPFKPFVNALENLDIQHSRISNCYFPILMDLNLASYKPGAIEQIDSFNRKLLEPFRFIIFHPSRLIINKKPALVDSGHWKGNDRLFEALAVFIKRYNKKDICIAMPDRKYSPDRDLAKSLIENLGITDNIVWLKPPTDAGFPRNELMNYYSLSHMVADEFATGWFGSVVVEGLACSKPVLSYVDEEVMQKLYPWHPIVSSDDPEVLAEKIAEYYFDETRCRQQGELSRKWAETFHSTSQGTEIYLNNFRTELKELFSINS